jgi:hypothetical protein
MPAFETKFLEKVNYPKKCPKCGQTNWKFSFSPFIWKGKEGVVEERICGNCGFKPALNKFLKSKKVKEQNKAHNI